MLHQDNKFRNYLEKVNFICITVHEISNTIQHCICLFLALRKWVANRLEIILLQNSKRRGTLSELQLFLVLKIKRVWNRC